MGCTISPALFVLDIQVIPNTVEPCIPEAHIGRGLHMPPIKAFMDNRNPHYEQKAGIAKNYNQTKQPARWVQKTRP